LGTTPATIGRFHSIVTAHTHTHTHTQRKIQHATAAVTVAVTVAVAVAVTVAVATVAVIEVAVTVAVATPVATPVAAVEAAAVAAAAAAAVAAKTVQYQDRTARVRWTWQPLHSLHSPPVDRVCVCCGRMSCCGSFWRVGKCHASAVVSMS